MQEAVIIAATRTAVGRALKGTLADTRPDDMAATVVRGLLKRAPGLTPDLIDDLVLGCAFPEGEQGMNMARQVVLLAGLPEAVSAMTLNRFCASGLEAIHIAALKIACGAADCVIAGGVESMSLIPMGGGKIMPNPTLTAEYPEIYMNMGLTAERVAEQEGISREDQDLFACTSHSRALTAQANGLFAEEITPLQVRQVSPAGKLTRTNSREILFEQDEGPRPETTPAALAKLRPAFKTGGSVTAGNTSQMSDGAAGVIVTSADFARKHGLKPLARYVTYATMGVAPELMGLGPIKSVPLALNRAGLHLDDIDLVELNEAFASQSLAVIRTLGLDTEKVNVNGGAIALGHPLGCTGAKLTVQVIHELNRRKGKNAMVTMCIGGGMGAAGIFTRAES
ncbi:MAG: thiolase family protein [bacterium]|nr:thiolase family protein [bacterium]